MQQIKKFRGTLQNPKEVHYREYHAILSHWNTQIHIPYIPFLNRFQNYILIVSRYFKFTSEVLSSFSSLPCPIHKPPSHTFWCNHSKYFFLLRKYCENAIINIFDGPADIASPLGPKTFFTVIYLQIRLSYENCFDTHRK